MFNGSIIIAMKIDDLRASHESDRITIVLGIIATYIALFSVKNELPFDITIVFDTSGYVLIYLVGYLAMTAFCYRHDNEYTEFLTWGMNIFRRRYYDIGAMFLPFVFCNMIVWSFTDSPLMRTIGMLVLPLIFVVQSYRGFRHEAKNKKSAKKE